MPLNYIRQYTEVLCYVSFAISILFVLGGFDYFVTVKDDAVRSHSLDDDLEV